MPAKPNRLTDDKQNQCLITRRISGLQVFDIDGTEIKGLAVSVSGQGAKDFEITIEGIPSNIFSYKFKHHIDHYKNLFNRNIEKDNIVEIGIDEQEKLFIKPEKTSFPLIYRTATEVHWNDKDKSLYSPKPNEWTYLDWYKQIIGVVETECNCKLILVDTTIWTNIPYDLKKSMTEVYL